MSEPSLQAKPLSRIARRHLRWLLGLLCCLPSVLIGCAAVTNPVADGIPARFLPPEAFGESKELYQQIPEAYLRQPPPEIYKLASGDVLGIWIEGVLGEKSAIPPVISTKTEGGRPPALGFPIPVREDGTIPLPLLKQGVKVSGLSLEEAQAAIIKAYTTEPNQEILRPDRARVIVTLIQPRTYRVLVLREDAGSVSFGSTGGTGGLNSGSFFSETRRSTGTPLDLSAYENDLLNALTRSGGMPGFEAEEEVIIQRSTKEKGANGKKNLCPPFPHPDHLPPVEGGVQGDPSSAASQEPETIRIPIRLRIGEKPTFKPSDIILQDGDIVSVHLRRGEVFYTGGLIPPRMFPLPRTRDLDVVEALILVGAPIINGGLGINNLSGTTQASGIGSPSPSLVTVLRRTSGGGQIPIRVSVNRAFRDPRERIRILPGDIIILQETMLETVTRYVTNVWRFNFFGTIVRQQDLTGTSSLNVP